MAYIIVTNFTGFSLGEPGGASYAVFATSLFILLFMVLVVYFFVRDRHQIKSLADKIFLYSCLASAVCITGYLGIWGLIGLRLWA
jgi:hypothetical protein